MPVQRNGLPPNKSTFDVLYISVKYFCDVFIPLAIERHYVHIGINLLFQLTCGVPQGDFASPDVADLYCHSFEDEYAALCYLPMLRAFHTLQAPHSYQNVPHLPPLPPTTLPAENLDELLPLHLQEFALKLRGSILRYKARTLNISNML